VDKESSSTSLSESLSSIQKRIVASEFDGALADLAELRESYPYSEDALYMSALCNRYTLNFKESLSILSRLVELVPDSGRAWQETGHTHRDMGQLQEALHNYTRACQLNPALEGSWNSIQKIATQLGRTRQAAHAKSNIERIKKTPQPLVVAADMIAEGKLLRAEDICRDFLKKVPHHIEAMRLLADIGLKLGVLTDAEFLLESAVLFAPENVQVRMDYIQALTRRQFYDKALEQSKHLLEREPDSAQFQSLHAVSAVQAGDLIPPC
jgi:tetratricopeptide (TPR) repeat protein